MYVCDSDRADSIHTDDNPDWFCRPLANDTIPRHEDGCVNRETYGGDWAVFDVADAETAFALWTHMAETQRWPTVEQELFEAAYRAGAMSFPDIDECI